MRLFAITACLITLLAGGCVSPSSSQKPALRYDGLYYSSDGPSENFYLRFYEDGTVVSATVDSQLKVLPNWLQRDHGNEQGHYRLVGSTLTFNTADYRLPNETTAEVPKLHYNGRVSPGSLVLHWINSSLKLSGYEVYHFITLPAPVPPNTALQRTTSGRYAPGVGS